MSFLLDPPLLFLSGMAIYKIGNRLGWNRQSKILVGIGISFVFIFFSALLYSDLIRCVFPIVCGMKGSEFMLHTMLTGITKDQVPTFIVVFLFILYPIWIFAGYSTSLNLKKRKRFSKVIHSTDDVKSRNRYGPLNVAVARNKNPKDAVQEAMSSLGGMEKYVRKGDKVLIKINICGGVPEIKGTYTSTDVTLAVVDMVKAAGGEPIVTDADMIWTRFWRAAEDSGYAKWALENNVKLVNISDTRIVRLDFGNNSVVGIENVSKEMIDADVIISLPTMKTHMLTGVTLGMKNMYGTFPEIDKAKYHTKGIEDVIYEINAMFRPTLTIIDGTIGGEAIGPLSCKPIGYDTIIASGDVVAADSVACQLMGYDPLDINHIKKANENGLGNALAKFDLRDLPYPNILGKDGHWDKLDAKVKNFYEWGIEFLLKFPGWETMFNIGADFFLYDLARLPVFRYFTPSVLQLLSDVVNVHTSKKSIRDDKQKRSFNVFSVLFIAFLSLVGFYFGGDLEKSTALFNLGYMAAIVFAVLGALKLKTSHLMSLVVSAPIIAMLVETINTESGLLNYSGSFMIYLFVVGGWTILMVAIFYLAGLSSTLLKGFGTVSRLQNLRSIFFIATFIIFLMFMYLEGYWQVADLEVRMMYMVMGLIGLVVSSRRSAEWNLSLMAISIVIGGSMELLGSLDGLWHYRFGEPLAIWIVLSWAINSWAVHGLSCLLGVDITGSEMEL